MTVYVALFRGINVGGHHKLPMQDLRDILAARGCEDVKTYIQSGNAVFKSPETPIVLETEIRTAVAAKFGFAPRVLILDADQFRAIAAANPYSDAEETPALLHVSFLEQTPAEPDLQSLQAISLESEQFELIGRAFYMHAPDGIARSKLAGRVEKALGVEATGRNWRTVSKVLNLVSSIAQ